MNGAYRSAYDQIVGARVAEVRRAQDLAHAFRPRLDRVRAARIARLAGGTVALIGGIAFAPASVLDHGYGTTILLASSVLGVVVWGITRLGLAAGLRLRSQKPATEALPVLTGRLDDDLRALDACDPRVNAVFRPSGLERWSLALPLAATSLLAPLTLHFLFYSVVAPEPFATNLNFDAWIGISAIVVGHAHLALVAMCVRFARKLAAASHQELDELRAFPSWGQALLVAMGTAAMPGILLWAIPPVLAAVTGVVFVPAMFILARRRALADRMVAHEYACALA
jgi:hypothetical protein